MNEDLEKRLSRIKERLNRSLIEESSSNPDAVLIQLQNFLGSYYLITLLIAIFFMIGGNSGALVLIFGNTLVGIFAYNRIEYLKRHPFAKGMILDRLNDELRRLEWLESEEDENELQDYLSLLEDKYFK